MLRGFGGVERSLGDCGRGPPCLELLQCRSRDRAEDASAHLQRVSDRAADAEAGTDLGERPLGDVGEHVAAPVRRLTRLPASADGAAPDTFSTSAAPIRAIAGLAARWARAADAARRIAALSAPDTFATRSSLSPRPAVAKAKAASTAPTTRSSMYSWTP